MISVDKSFKIRERGKSVQLRKKRRNYRYAEVRISDDYGKFEEEKSGTEMSLYQ